jgi:hypothetical protein
VVVDADPVVCVLEAPEVEVLPLEEVDDACDVEELDSEVDVLEVEVLPLEEVDDTCDVEELDVSEVDVSDVLVVEEAEPEVVLVEETGSEVVEVVSVVDSDVDDVLEVDVVDVLEGIVEVEVVVWPHSPARDGTASGPFPMGTSFDPQSSDWPTIQRVLVVPVLAKPI